MTALRKSANHTEIEPELSIVIPSFNEQNNLQALYSELMKVFPSLNMTWEIIFYPGIRSSIQLSSIIAQSGPQKELILYWFQSCEHKNPDTFS